MLNFQSRMKPIQRKRQLSCAQLLDPPHFWLSAAFEVISKSQADLSRPFSYVQTSSMPSVGRAPTEHSSKISYMVGSTHSFCLQKAHVLGTSELELVMLTHKQWTLVTWRCHLRLSASEADNKKSTTCQKMPKGPFFQFVRSHASCRDPVREELEAGRELCRQGFQSSQRRFRVMCRIINVHVISDWVCLTNSSLIFIPTGREQDPQREYRIS